MKAIGSCLMDNLREILLLLCLLLIPSAAHCNTQHAPDYFADAILSRTTVNIASTQIQPTKLHDILVLIEKQTQLQLIYLNTQIPAQDRIMIESPPEVSLAHLLDAITTMTGVTFSRHDHKIVVRSPMETGGQSVIASKR